jgi:hypothetical protein
MIITHLPESHRRCSALPSHILSDPAAASLSSGRISGTGAPQVNPQIQIEHGDSASNKQVQGKIGIHQRVEVVQKERTAIRRDAAAYLKPVFKHRERAPRISDFDDHKISSYFI